MQILSLNKLAINRKEGIEEGILEGEARGKNEATVQNIKTMNKNGATVELIAKLLGLDTAYVKTVLQG